MPPLPPLLTASLRPSSLVEPPVTVVLPHMPQHVVPLRGEGPLDTLTLGIYFFIQIFCCHLPFGTHYFFSTLFFVPRWAKESDLATKSPLSRNKYPEEKIYSHYNLNALLHFFCLFQEGSKDKSAYQTTTKTHNTLIHIISSS